MANNKPYQPDASFQKAGVGKTWDYKAAGVNAVFFGVFMYKEENVGPNNSNLYTFMQHKDDKFKSPIEEMGIWGNTLLDTRFKSFTKGEQVVVIYLGQEKSEKRKGATYHNFEVYHKPAPLQNVEDPTKTFDGGLDLDNPKGK